VLMRMNSSPIPSPTHSIMIGAKSLSHALLSTLVVLKLANALAVPPPATLDDVLPSVAPSSALSIKRKKSWSMHSRSSSM
jgi:hypothetical protein